MRVTIRAAASAAAFLVLAACSNAPAPATSESSASPKPPSDPGTVSGQAPPAIGGFPSIVVLEPHGTVTPEKTPVPVMDQAQQTFSPPLLLVRTGEPVEFRNSDDVLHNVKVREEATRDSTFNVAIPTGEKFIFVFSRDGFYDVGCDIHPAMSAQIMATSSPFSALAEAGGPFTLTGIPPGQYRAIAYAGERKIEREVTVPLSAALDLTRP